MKSVQVDPPSPLNGWAQDKMIMDTTWQTTPDFPSRPEWDGAVHPPEVKMSAELRKFVDKRWPEYGID
jgi:hypothetical protein